MSGNVERTLEKFLRSNLAKKRSDAIVKASLRHAAPGSKGHDVDDFPIGTEIDDSYIDSMVTEILGRAQEDADGMGGQQRYVVHLYETGNKKAVARFMFRLRGIEDEYDETSGEEAPTLKGLVQQQMRHNEALARMVTVGFGGMMQHMNRRLDKAEETNLQLLDQRQQAFLALEAAQSTAHDRDIQLLEVEGKEKRKDQMFQKLSLLLPAAVNKLAGQKVFDAKDPMILMLSGFVDTLDQSQFEKILGALTNEQKVVMMQLIQTVKSSSATKTE